MKFNAKVDNMNVGNDFQNINVILSTGEKRNVKLDESQVKLIELGKTYHFEVEIVVNNEKEQLKLVHLESLFDHIDDPYELKDELTKFYQYAPVDIKELKESIEFYLGSITNPVIKQITKHIYDKYEKAFYMYPAAVRFHHAYIGGLAYHTKTMLDIAKRFSEVYTYLNKDYLYSGILLHDVCKIKELSGFEGGEYTVEGQLIGHLVMGAIEIDRAVKTLELESSEEALILKHILISHHGLPNFGAAKKPATAEAMLIWYIDTIDSKFTVLGEELEKTNPGEFTQNIAVLDKQRFFKPNK